MAKILIVDDSQDICEVLSIMVQSKGHEVATVSSKMELVAKLHFVKPDLVLLDVRLNGEDGRAVCKEIKTNYPELPIILLSGSPELLEGYLTYAADDMIEKPFDMDNLLMKINTHLPTELTR